MVSTFEQVWCHMMRNCTNHQQLEEAVQGAIRANAYGDVARWTYVQQLNRLASEDAIRLDERIRVLREVRNAVAAAEREAHDPYLWGYGVMLVRKYLTWMLAEARRAAGQEPPR